MNIFAIEYASGFIGRCQVVGWTQAGHGKGHVRGGFSGGRYISRRVRVFFTANDELILDDNICRCRRLWIELGGFLFDDDGGFDRNCVFIVLFGVLEKMEKYILYS
ncbi:hypothetical protein CDAR_470831 [Caerostris darwini]|uniref:Uncharacterized protein n=1 Tax=Caerostris darwini TaxID=1538125 RepID=A0AAV4VGI7_9ARAC|nr:hypothetical protein CDAR_470831 [Caerostris darwini]